MKRRILISFSGGKTSAYMTWYMLHKYKAVWNPELKMFIGIDENNLTVEMVCVFANTSKENEATLEFIRDCDNNFGFHTVWIETIMQEHGKGAKYRIINFEQAKRNGEVFESIIKKHGIPNMANIHCTREMKTTPIRALLREEYGWKPKDYETAIGYRIDEPKRWKTKKKRESQRKKKHIYPFVDDKQVTKPQVNGWWSFQDFNLNLEDHEGNCDLCYKKSENKLIAIVGCNPDKGKWWSKMEEKYDNFIPDGRKHNTKIKTPIYFYRGHTSMQKIQEKADKFFAAAKGDDTSMEVYKQALLNHYNPKQMSLCNESCEPF